MRTNLTFPTTSRGRSMQESFALRRKLLEKISVISMEAPSSERFSIMRLKLLGRPDGFMLYGALVIDVFSAPEFLCPNKKNRLRLIRTRPKFYLIGDNPNVSLGVVDCSVSTRRFVPKDDYHKKRMEGIA